MISGWIEPISAAKSTVALPRVIRMVRSSSLTNGLADGSSKVGVDMNTSLELSASDTSSGYDNRNG